MSHIPSSAMPHAAPSANSDNNQNALGGQHSQNEGMASSVTAAAGKIADLARENPKTAIAAGAAVVAGVAAAAAIPLVRNARSKQSETKSSAGKSDGTKSSASKKSD